MRVAITTTIITHIDLTEGASVEEARKEIFGKYNELLQDANDEGDCPVDALKVLADKAVVFDQVVGTEVSHTFGEASE